MFLKGGGETPMHTISASLIISMNLIMMSVLVCNFSLSFLLLQTAVFVGTVANIFWWGKKRTAHC